MFKHTMHTLAMAALMAMTALTSSASAQEIDADCNEAVTEFAKEFGKASSKDADEVKSNFQSMRQGCAALRRCKTECRQAKRACKKDARGEKKDCKAECKALKGKDKRACKKSCRVSAKAEKKGCKAEKKECKNDCRAAHLVPACKAGRNQFWNSLGDTLKEAASAAAEAAGQNVKNACSEVYSKN